MNVYIVVFVQMLLAGGTHFVAKSVVRDIDPFTLTMARGVISSLGLLALLGLRHTSLRIKRGDWGLMALLGFLATLNQFLYLYGLRFTTAANGALLYATTPVLVLILSRFNLRERMTVGKTSGVILAFLGIAVVIFERGVDLTSQSTAGNLIILLAVIAWSYFTILGRRMVIEYGALKTTSIATVAGTLFFLPVGAVGMRVSELTAASGSDVVGILYLGVGTSIFSYLLWYYALKKIEASKLAVFTNGQPIVATLLSVLFLDYALTGPFVIGGIIALGGILLTQRG